MYRYDPYAFLGLTFLLTWAPWLAAVWLGVGVGSTGGVVLIAIGGIGPTAAALLLLYRRGDAATRRDYWARALSLRRIPAAWYAVVLLLVPAIVLAAAAIAALLGEPFGAQLLEPRYRERPLALLPFALFALLFGPLPEELGWRGYCLDGLRARWTGLTASLILAAAHAAWHIPLFLIEGYPLRHHLDEPLMLLAYVAVFLPKSVLMTWLFYRTRRSTISAILFHFMINYTGMVTSITLTAELVQAVLYILVAAVVIAADRAIFFRRAAPPST